MIYSMTGFGRGQATVGGIDLCVEINSVNRRNLEISVSLPRDWQILEKAVQDQIRNKVNRGKLHVSVQAGPASTESGFHWDSDGLESSLNRLGTVAKAHSIAWPPDADALIRLAALNKVDVALPKAEDLQGSLLEMVEAAMRQLLAMRETEGLTLHGDLAGRVGTLVDRLDAIRESSTGTVPRYR